MKTILALALLCASVASVAGNPIYHHPSLPYGTSVVVSNYPGDVLVCYWRGEGVYVWQCDTVVNPQGAGFPEEVVLDRGIVVSPEQPRDETPVRVQGAKWVYYVDDEGVLQPMQGWVRDD